MSLPSIRASGVVLAVIALVFACAAQDAGASEVGPVAAPPSCIPASECCKLCDGGQACGNSCISRAKQCHKGRGCACNVAELCP